MTGINPSVHISHRSVADFPNAPNTSIFSLILLMFELISSNMSKKGFLMRSFSPLVAIFVPLLKGTVLA